MPVYELLHEYGVVLSDEKIEYLLAKVAMGVYLTEKFFDFSVEQTGFHNRVCGV